MDLNDFCRPSTLQEALQARAAGGMVYAGGTDLMVRRKHALDRGDTLHLLFLQGLAELQGVAADAGELRIGAMTTMSTAATHPLVPEILRQACAGVGSPALRNQATIGGNVCTASPAGDSLCALYACEAEVDLRSPQGGRRLPLEQFILGPGKTALAPDELLIALYLPDDRPTFCLHRKVGARIINAIAKVSLAAALWTDTAGRITQARFALGAVGPTVMRCRELEAHLGGITLTEAADQAQQLASLAGQAIRPIDDQRSTATYRRNAAENLIANVLRRGAAST